MDLGVIGNIAVDVLSNSIPDAYYKSLGNIDFLPDRAYFGYNSYTSVSLGVTRLRNGDTYVRGSLHKSFNVMAIDFSDENYYNIMGHTSEHLQLVTIHCKGGISENNINGKSLFNVTYYDGTAMIEQDFFQHFHSCCLIEVY